VDKKSVWTRADGAKVETDPRRMGGEIGGLKGVGESNDCGCRSKGGMHLIGEGEIRGCCLERGAGKGGQYTANPQVNNTALDRDARSNEVVDETQYFGDGADLYRRG